MIIVGTLLAAAAVVAVGFFRSKWGTRTEAPPQLTTAPMSETDERMQEKTREVIHETFGGDVVSSIKEMKSSERVRAAEEFTQKLAEEYGLEDTEVSFYGDAREKCGHYSLAENKLSLNVADLLVEDEETLPVRINEFLDTVIHELRHAVQRKAIEEEGFWDVGPETRCEWARNFADYISPGVDPRGYAGQPVEVDARTFAAGCLEGVIL